MKTQTVITYSISELKEQLPRAYDRALENYRNVQYSEIFWQDETIDSLKAVVKAAGLTLRDWSLGAYKRNNFIEVHFSSDEVADLSGKRAFAWLENNLFAQFRVSFQGRERWKLSKFGAGYRPGCIKPCPLTGYCADEDYLQSLRDDVKSGCTLKEAFENLESVCAKLLEAEAESQSSVESFEEWAQSCDIQFTEDGEQF